MRHYEIVLLIHPDQSAQVSTMIKRYQTLITNNGGQVHRFEDWGRRQLAYPLKGIHKAHYVLLNIETNDATLKELTNSFRFNDAIIRNIVLKQDAAITEVSPVVKAKSSVVESVEATPESAIDEIIEDAIEE